MVARRPRSFRFGAAGPVSGVPGPWIHLTRRASTRPNLEVRDLELRPSPWRTLQNERTLCEGLVCSRSTQPFWSGKTSQREDKHGLTKRGSHQGVTGRRHRPARRRLHNFRITCAVRADDRPHPSLQKPTTLQKPLIAPPQGNLRKVCRRRLAFHLQAHVVGTKLSVQPGTCRPQVDVRFAVTLLCVRSHGRTFQRQDSDILFVGVSTMRQ